MRIAVCEFGNESNTFSVNRSTFESMAPSGWIKPENLLEHYRGTSRDIGGMIRAAEEEQVELVPLPSIKVNAGPTICDKDLVYIVDYICAYLETVRDGLDGICFNMHGAGCAESVDDIEAYTLRALRKVVGDTLPITVTLDLHGNISQEMMDLSQGLFGIKENPHVDFEETGYLACKTLIRTIRGEIHPRSALIPLPVLITPATGNTYNEPMKSVKEHFAAYCREHGLIDTTFFHGFSAADFPGSSASVVVIADGTDPMPHAKALANYFWARRAEFVPISLTPDQAIDKALAAYKGGYVIINEISDNPGSGCPGDGTHLLRALLKRDLPRTVFQFIRDGEVAAQAHEAGVGAFLDIRLGAKSDNMHGEPIELTGVEVLALSDGIFEYHTPMYRGLKCNMGPSARLRHGNVEFIVTTRRVQNTDDGGLRMTGSDLSHYDIVCIKSANHFRAFFESRADAIVTADPPGLRSSNLSTYPYKRIRRPIYPLDLDCTFELN